MIFKIQDISTHFRPITEDDALLLVKLRGGEESERYLSSTDLSECTQREWLRKYLSRNASREEFYFVIVSEEQGDCGVIRLYNIDYKTRTFTIGSWTIASNAPLNTAMESIALVYYYAFRILDLQMCHFEVMKNNKKVLRFHRLYAEEIRQDDDFVYFDLSSDKFFQSALVIQLGRGCNVPYHTIISPNTELGKYVIIGDLCCIEEQCKIKNYVNIGSGSHIQFGSCLHNNVEIGTHSVICGSCIHQGAKVGPGSVVIGDVPPYAIVRGNPAQIVGYVGTIHSKAFSKDTLQKNSSKTISAQFYNIPNFFDLRGHLCVLEWEKLLPFPVKRIFYTYGVPTMEVRGEHAHKECEQFLIALHGSLHVIADNGVVREEFVLDSPAQGLHLPAGVWGIQYKHSSDSVLLVLASHGYDASDYIRDYDEYLEYKKK